MAQGGVYAYSCTERDIATCVAHCIKLALTDGCQQPRSPMPSSPPSFWLRLAQRPKTTTRPQTPLLLQAQEAAAEATPTADAG